MMDNLTINEYKEIRDPLKKSFGFCIVVAMIMIGIVFIIYKFNFKVYEEINLIKKDNNYMVIVNTNQLEYIKSINEIYLDSQKYGYTIDKIDSDYSVVDNNLYQTVYLNLYNFKTISPITKGKILVRKKTLLEMLIEFIEGRDI